LIHCSGGISVVLPGDHQESRKAVPNTEYVPIPNTSNIAATELSALLQRIQNAESCGFPNGAETSSLSESES
jgi:hypothetical protein